MNATQTATDLVIAAARITRTVDRLEDRCYLCDVQAATGLDAASFTAALLKLWYADRIELSRADLVLDSAKVAASELQILTETFHYARLAV
jgi:hypothetical protein